MAETNSVLVSETCSTLSDLNPPSRIICRVCQKQFSQYTCPRCNARYCSLPCYKSHSLRCTESFMRDNVLGEMRQLHTDDEVKQKTLDMLKRFHSEEEEEMDTMDELDSTLSEETMEKILSGSQISYDDLSENEKKHFQRSMASGELSKLIKPWEPWWLNPCAKTLSLSRDGTPLVQPMLNEPSTDLENEQSNDIPMGPKEPLTPIHKLTSTEPSPLLSVHLVDIIYTYCFTLRLYNGDWQSDILGSAMVVLSMSSVIGHNVQPETVHEALSLCLEQTCSSDFKHMGGVRFGIGLLDDVMSLFSLGGYALVCLLSDMQRLIKAAERELKLEKMNKSKKVEMRSKLKNAERKIYFIMCWAHEQHEEVWSSLSGIVEVEKGLVLEFEGNKRGDERVDKKVETKGKARIEEIQ